MRPELWVAEVIEAGLPLSSRAEHPLRAVIADTLDELDEFYAEPLRMFAWENLTYEAIAKELGLAGRSSGHARVQAALKVFEPLLLKKLEEMSA